MSNSGRRMRENRTGNSQASYNKNKSSKAKENKPKSKKEKY